MQVAVFRHRYATYGFTILASAALASAVCLCLCWNKTARNYVKDAYYGVRGEIPRPNLERFGFDPMLEFRSAKLVEQPVYDPQSPSYVVRRGLEVRPHATGFSYPVNIAFAPPSDDDEAPLYYVAELHGAIKWVDRKGRVRMLCHGLLNFPPLEMKTSDEFGVSGLALVPGSHDLIVTSPLQDSASEQFHNVVRRVRTTEGGRKLDRIETVLSLDGEPASPSNQIQQAAFGPDGKLYVSVGDSMNWALSRDPQKWGGKILRMNADGTPCEDNNPFYEKKATVPCQNYVFALGLRNSFDFAFEPKSQRIWAGDVGQDLNRLVEIERGRDLGWDGTDDSFCREARHLFQDRFIPTGICFMPNESLGAPFSGTLLVAGYGNDIGRGPGRSKRIVGFEVRDGRLISGPGGLVAYVGEHQSTMLGLAAGPDGLYFTDMFGEQSTGKAAGHGRVMKVSASTRTAALPVDDKPHDWKKWSSTDRGKYLFVFKGSCGKCHTVERLTWGKEGPNLTRVVPRIRERLASRDYWEELDRHASERLAEHQTSIEAVRSAKADARVRVWLRAHVLDPRFDNARGKMPGFGQAQVFDDGELEALLDFVQTLE